MVIHIATVAQGVVLAEGRGHAAGGGQQPSPCIILVLHHCCAGTVYDGDYIALQIGNVVVRHIIVANHQGPTVRTVAEAQHHTAPSHLSQLGAVIQVTISNGAIGPACPHTVDIVGKVPGGTALRHGSKLPTIFPGVFPGAIRRRISNGVVLNLRTVILNQQIAPIRIVRIVRNVRIAVSIGDGIKEGFFFVIVFPLCQNVACAIVYPFPNFSRRLVILPGQLVGRVVLIGSGLAIDRFGDNVAIVIVGIGIGEVIGGIAPTPCSDLIGCVCVVNVVIIIDRCCNGDSVFVVEFDFEPVQPAVIVVGVICGNYFVGDLTDAAGPVVFILRGVEFRSNIFFQGDESAQIIV